MAIGKDIESCLFTLTAHGTETTHSPFGSELDTVCLEMPDKCTTKKEKALKYWVTGV